MTADGSIERADLWQRAAAFAARAHLGQVRKDGVTPYAAHPFRVAMTVRDVFGCDDPVCLAAALLHDAIEDCGVDYDDLLEGFGAEVADCVAALSKDDRLREDLREPAYDEQLRAADWRARLVKLGDVFDNTCDRLTRVDNPSTRKLVRRCERALAIARETPDPPAALARAIDAVEALVARVTSG
jgi:(p)ppGpp synthase/HD superfamily hydrolase